MKSFLKKILPRNLTKVLEITFDITFNKFNTRQLYLNKIYNYFFIRFNGIKFNSHVSDIALFNCFEYKESQKNSNPLHFAPLLRVQKILSYLPTKYEKYNFIDIGAGKGILMYFILKNYKFNFVYGLEFEKSFFEDAKENLKKFNNKFKLIYNDAKIYKLPDIPFLIYLYNPFKEYIFNKFIDNNIENFKKNKSVLLYHNDTYSENLKKRNDVKRYIEIEQGSSIYFF